MKENREGEASEEEAKLKKNEDKKKKKERWCVRRDRRKTKGMKRERQTSYYESKAAWEVLLWADAHVQW